MSDIVPVIVILVVNAEFAVTWFWINAVLSLTCVAKSAPLVARVDAFAARLICVLSEIELNVTISTKDAAIVILVDSGTVLIVVVVEIADSNKICVERSAVTKLAELTEQFTLLSDIPDEDIGLELIG